MQNTAAVPEQANIRRTLEAARNAIAAADSEWNNCKPGPESETLHHLLGAVEYLATAVSALEAGHHA